MLAPEPFFEPRGTPFSEYHRIKALGELGHRVDLVTYPIGRDVELPGLRIVRGPGLPFVRRVPIGPSLTKLALDVLMLGTVLRLARRGGYDAIHSHEEMGLVGAWLARWLNVPHLYDMHSSLPQQLANFRYSRSRLLRRLFEWAERRTIAGSAVVVTICPELQDTVEAMGFGDRALLIENVMGGEIDGPEESRSSHAPVRVRAEWGIAPEAPLAVYTGTLEPYQGVDLLIGAAARLARTHPSARVLVVGGQPAQVEAVRARAAAAGAGSTMVWTGQRPAAEIPAFVAAADVLVSPRVHGTNTPLKIYSYLRAGKPIVATALRTHTQVLTPAVARLVPPDPEALAAALGALFDDPAERVRLGGAARALAETRYSRAAYLARTAEACARLMRLSGGRPTADRSGAPAAAL